MIKLTQQEFLTKANIIHNHKYDYTLTMYKNCKSYIDIVCKIHGKFSQLAGSHLAGRGCIKCTHNNIINNEIIFLQKAKLKHNSIYDYSLVKYKNARTKIEIICISHGLFKQTPDNHLKHGCYKCMMENLVINNSHTMPVFISNANRIHNYIYDYSLVKYKNAKTKVIIICSQHGSFKQTPDIHLNGAGCPKCTRIISRPEIKWLDLLGIDSEHRQAKIKINGKIIKPDAFDPKTNTIYEFYGDYYHGNPKIFNQYKINPTCNKTYGELYSRTIDREILIRAAGFNLITIWENDFNQIIQ